MAALQRDDGAESALVKRHDPPRAAALGEHNEGGICEADPQVAVAGEQRPRPAGQTLGSTLGPKRGSAATSESMYRKRS